MPKYHKRLIYLIIITFTLLFCSAVLAQETAKKDVAGWNIQGIVDRLQTFVTDYGLKIIGAIVILIVGRIIAGIARKITAKIMQRARIDETIISFVSPLIYFLVLAFTVVAALAKFGVETASFVAILGAAAFAIGFALQGSLSNFAAGVMILLFRPYKIGDVIESAGVVGSVKEIHVFSTTLSTPENMKVIVPNSKIYGDVIKNITGYDTRRAIVEIGISYDSPIEKAIQVAMDVMKSEPLVLDDPEPMVAVMELGDSSVNLTVRFWVETVNYWDARFTTIRKIKEAYDANGIEIPFPQRVIHMASESNS